MKTATMVKEKIIEKHLSRIVNYAKIGVTHFCGKKASDSNTLSASLLIFKISHPLEKKKCIFLHGKVTVKRNCKFSNAYKI